LTASGTIIGRRYRLENQVSDTVRTEVWRGCDEVLQRPVTIKLVRSGDVPTGAGRLAVTGAVGEPPKDGAASDGDVMRTFALHRIIDIELRMSRFRMPNLRQWDPETLYSAAWGLYSGPAREVVVEVHPAFAEVVAERRWHQSQRLGSAGADGWVPMHFEVFTGGEFRSWLLSWGPWLRVVSPIDLRQWVEGLAALSPGEGEPDDDEVFRIV